MEKACLEGCAQELEGFIVAASKKSARYFQDFEQNPADYKGVEAIHKDVDDVICALATIKDKEAVETKDALLTLLSSWKGKQRQKSMEADAKEFSLHPSWEGLTQMKNSIVGLAIGEESLATPIADDVHAVLEASFKLVSESREAEAAEWEDACTLWKHVASLPAFCNVFANEKMEASLLRWRDDCWDFTMLVKTLPEATKAGASTGTLLEMDPWKMVQQNLFDMSRTVSNHASQEWVDENGPEFGKSEWQSLKTELPAMYSTLRDSAKDQIVTATVKLRQQLQAALHDAKQIAGGVADGKSWADDMPDGKTLGAHRAETLTGAVENQISSLKKILDDVKQKWFKWLEIWVEWPVEVDHEEDQDLLDQTSVVLVRIDVTIAEAKIVKILNVSKKPDSRIKALVNVFAETHRLNLLPKLYQKLKDVLLEQKSLRMNLGDMMQRNLGLLQWKRMKRRRKRQRRRRRTKGRKTDPKTKTKRGQWRRQR